ncbi:RNA polymerase sigma factor [Spirosoma fluminis]
MATHHQLKDEELIRMHLRSEQNNYFETLYNRYVSKVYRRCLSLTKDSAQAEDFTHDIFLRVHGNLGSFKENSAFSTWLYSISYNYCMDQLRYANRTSTVSIEQDQEYTWSDSSEQETTEFRLQHLAQVMGTISPEETLMLRLKYEQGLDIREIAEQFGLKDSAVKMRLKRTRDKIRRMYGEQSY